ncbi:hypothetical protein C8R44DRAFT_987664 [Mycena epipterygia]|nr:hypothetical protein C8R44DRAFT_987664 [Mycena epipterygia]
MGGGDQDHNAALFAILPALFTFALGATSRSGSQCEAQVAQSGRRTPLLGRAGLARWRLRLREVALAPKNLCGRVRIAPRVVRGAPVGDGAREFVRKQLLDGDRTPATGWTAGEHHLGAMMVRYPMVDTDVLHAHNSIPVRTSTFSIHIASFSIRPYVL